MYQKDKEAAFSELYHRHAKCVYNSIHRIVAHTAEAEDILQETFLTVYHDIEKLNHIIHIEAWIKRIAINKAISHLRKQKISFTEFSFLDMEAESEYDVNENEIFENKVEDIRNSIKNLPQGYKTIVNLYLFEQISQEEIARMLGLSHTTVRTQYHRAKKKILLSLKDKVYE